MKFSVPQGSVLGPKYYTMYTKPLSSICKKSWFSSSLYADDSQLYLSFKPTDNVAHTEALGRVERCLNDIVAWMHDNMLKLNTDKTELIVFASQRNAKFVENVSVTIGESNIKSSSCVQNLGASLDSKLNMEKQVNAISRSCFVQLLQINHIRKYQTADATKFLVNSRLT